MQEGAPALDFLSGGGQMGALMRAFDWSTTALGPFEQWPQSLRTSVSICLNSRFPMIVWWGPSLTLIYNDQYIPVLGQKHPERSLGRAGKECWAEVWDVVGPLLERVMQEGEANWADDLLLFINRSGYLEECYFRFSYSPIRDETGGIGGVFTPVSETTQKVIAERRLETLRRLANAGYAARDVIHACTELTDVLSSNPFDVPFVIVYSNGPDQIARRVCLTGLDTDTSTSPAEVSLNEDTTPLQRAFAAAHIVDLDGQELHAAPNGPWDSVPLLVRVLPVVLPGETAIAAWLVAGTSARKALDRDYRSFFDLVVQQFAAALAAARAHEVERERAVALADMDRVKTTFFSNVSHELRTPLTLMLGPMDQILEDARLPQELRAPLSLVQRNSQRLLKLVNSLLDFARIEAGRAEASFQPTDLAVLTRELASTFRSAIERAGLRFQVDCDPLCEPVYVDRDMWEKVVLNLLSNAFKFTLTGEIAVRLYGEDTGAVLTIADTGIGVPKEEVPRLFERFHRIERNQARTHEGTGIGLALVHELVRLNGGTVRVISELDRGTCFTVRLPFGIGHVPFEALSTPRPHSAASVASVFVQEAMRWLPDEKSDNSARVPAHWDSMNASRDPRFAATFGARLILADDNADMRAYVSGLLAPMYSIETASDGHEALLLARAHRPDLIMTDVMMPRVDGFGLLAAIRKDEALRSVPVVMLSARAGEESRIEGFDAGADDYLTKPFSARELIARVGALLELGHMRGQTEQALRLRTEQFQTLLNDAPLGVYLVDADFRVREVNPTARPVFGDIEGLIGQDFDYVIHVLWPKAYADEVVRIFRHTLDTGEPYFAPERIEERRDRGNIEFYEWQTNRIALPDGRFGVVCYFRDISEHIRSRTALEDADRQKDEFLAMLAHELRNPLSSIRSAGDLLSRLGLTDVRAQSAARIIKRQAIQLTRLVDDLLDISRITRGLIELKRQPVELNSIVNGALDTVDPIIREKRHRVSLVSEERRVYVDGDPARLLQCVVNVLTNAAKYTDPGGAIGIELMVRSGQCILTISDTGTGIAPELLPRIFDPFVQSERTLDRSEGGLGIGLAVVRRLVQMHGGSVTARSDGLGLGSTFELQFSHVEAPEVQKDGLPAATRSPRRVLIVDDNVDAAEALALTLKLEGHETESVHSSREVLKRIDSFRPEVILLDIGLPEMNGYELAREIRSRTHLNGLRLIALTGYGQADDRRLALQAGFDEHLVKPVDFDDLSSALGDY